MRSQKSYVAFLIIAGLSIVLGGPTLNAHHAFAAEFDARKPVLFVGTVTKVEWINPHCWFHIDVKQPDGTVQTWKVEAGNPQNLFKRGFSKDIIKVGMEIKVDGYASKDGSNRANGRNMTFPDGKTLFMGSSGTGAPADGKDPTEPK